MQDRLLILDLDDVLANLREALYQALSRVTGIDRHWRDWRHYDLGVHFDLEHEQLQALLVREGVLEACRPEPGAAVATQALAGLGLRLCVITARAWHPQALSLTRDWLEAHGIVHHDLRVVPLGSDKLRAVPVSWPVLLAVDDHPHNIDRYHRAGIDTVLVDRPWNSDHRGYRVHSLAALVEHVGNRLEALQEDSQPCRSRPTAS